ncbi:MAG TPA: PAS domain S-box protein [Bacteroidales bacterium]|nr:PAS domain S-box protein [Bacteroidales bacterium]
MNQENNNSITITKNDIFTGTGASLVLVLAAWLADILGNDLSFGFSAIARIHAANPGIWFIDMLPLVVGGTIYYYYRKRQKEIELFEEIIQQRDLDIDRNATFAKKIGEGNYDAHFEIKDENDILGKSLLRMKDNLLEGHKKEKDRNWIAEGKDLISDILRIHNSIDDLAYDVIVQLIQYINTIQGALYIYDDEERKLTNVTTYAYNRKRFINQEFKIGEGLIGECAYEMDYIYRTEIPDDYASITSGILGEKKPRSILIVPLIADEKLQGVIEFADLRDEIPELTINFLRELAEIIARTIYNLKMNQKTERLLQESQQMTEELKENEEQLRQNAEEMRATQEELEKSNKKLETQIKEVENAQKRLQALLENASEVISIYDEDIKLKYQSPNVKNILGYTQEEMMEGKDMNRLTAKGEAALKDMFRKLKENPAQPQSLQYTYIKKDGKKIYLETTGRNMLDDPAINGIILNSRDITERRRAEKEQRMKSKMQSLSENSPDLILRLNTRGQFFYANPVTADYLGFNPQELINTRIRDLQMEETLADFFHASIKDVKADNNHQTKEITFPTANLGERIMSFKSIPEFNENELETILFVGHDITEAKRIEMEIQDKNNKITESINYARRIQSSILPDTTIVQEYLPKSFIFYEPRDVVSGDFPWFYKNEDIIFIAAVDCTGHGVPGALLSFIGYFQLNNIVDHNKNYTAAQVLDKLHFGVRSTLKQDQFDAEARDGMDIALCRIDKKKNEIQYSGAHRPLYLLRDGELIQYKGNRKAIGGIPHRKKPEKDFVNHTVQYQEGDKIFFFTDGLPDQIGGPDKRKYTPKKIRENILANQELTMQQFNSFFASDYRQWKKNNKQIDDVLLIGIEF